MEENWYFKQGTIEIGPLDDKSIKEFIEEGRVTHETLVKVGDDGEWVKGADVAGLFTPIIPITPPPLKPKPKLKSPGTQKQSAVISDVFEAMDPIMSGKQTVCPHCWTKFPREKILYIAQHSSLYGDDVIAGGDEQLRFLPSRFSQEGHAIDERGMNCPDMACPRCHLRIPKTIIALTSMFFSVVGAPQSGKSYFLASMIREMRTGLAELFNFSFEDADLEINAQVNRYEEQIFNSVSPEHVSIIEKTTLGGALYNHIKLDEMDFELPMPFIFKLQPTETSLENDDLAKNLVIYDNAGEHFLPGQEHVTRPATMHLAHSHGLIFLFDPILDSKMKLKCASTDPQYKKLSDKITNQRRLLTEMKRRIHLHSGMKTTTKYSHPLIIAVSKYDLWQSELPDKLREIDPWVRDSKNYTYKMDLESILNVSYHVRELLREVVPAFVRTAESFSTRVLFVPVSSMGTSSEVDDQHGTGLLGFRPEKVDPIWAGVPVLILLAAQGYIPLEKGKARVGKIAKGEERGGVISFIHPETDEMIKLPSVYAGASLRHFKTGELFTVPGEFSWALDESEKNDDDFWPEV